MSYMPVWYQQGRSALLLIQSVIALLLVSCSMNRRKQFYLRLITSVLAGCAVQYLVRGIYIVGSTPPAMLSHAAAALLVYITLSAITWFCYDESIWTVLLMTATGYIGQDIAGSVKTLFRQIEWVNSFSRQQGGILIVDLVCYGAVYVLMFFALRPFVRNRNDNFDNKRKAVSSVLVLLLCIGMARLTQDNPNRNQQAVIAEALGQIVIDVLVIALQYGVMEQARLAKNMETMRELVHTQRVQYEASKESAQLINEKYHDLKHLLKSFRGTVPQEQLDQLKHSIAAYERPANSGNEVLDVVLRLSKLTCDREHIQLSCLADGNCLGFMRTRHVYSLFNNAVGNAIEAVRKLPDEDKRVISLSVGKRGNQAEIEITNYFDGQVVRAGETTKEDRSHHGFGTMSMRYVVEEYGGNLSIQTQKDIFTLFITIPVPGTA